MKLIVIKPKGNVFDVRRYQQQIENGLSVAAKGAKVDFDTTTQTWKHRPTFTIESEPGKRIIATDDTIYGYVDEGTKPHIIAPKNGKVLVFGIGGKAKTAPRVIGSKAGSKGGAQVITPKPVHHPGTEAREFAKTIRQKWDEELPKIMQRYVGEAAK